MHIINDYSSSPKKRKIGIFQLNHDNDAWILSAVLSLVMMIFVAVSVPSTFVSDVADDRFLASYYAGYWTGIPESQLPFIHPLYSLFISLLYRLFPGGYWYPNVFIFLLYTSSVVIMRTVFVLTKKANLPLWVALIANIAVYSLICYDQIWISFTTTPGVMCGAAAAMLLCKEDNRKAELWHNIIAISFIVLAFLIRWETAIVGVCFSAAAVFYRLIVCLKIADQAERLANLRRGTILILVTVLLVSAIYISLEIYEILPGNIDYYEFRQACAAYYDYPHNVEDVHALRAELGVSDAMAYLIRQWFFMDSRIDADMLNTLCGATGVHESGSLLVLHNSLYDALKLAERAILSPIANSSYSQSATQSSRLLIYPSVLVFLFSFLLFLRFPKKTWIEFISIFFTCIGAFLLCLYSCFLGRFPLRVLRLIALPNFFVGILLLLHMCAKIKVNVKHTCGSYLRYRRWRVYVSFSMLIISTLGVFNCAYALADDNFSLRKQDCIATSQALDDLAISNPDNIYFFGNDLCLFNEAYPKYGDITPKNLMYWGGCYVGREPYNNQMKANGFDTLDASLFLQNNVYFLGLNKESPDEMKCLLSYLQERFGIQDCTLVDSIADGKILIYSFS